MTEFSLTGSALSLVGLIALSAIFSGSETGLMSINRYRLQHAARKGNKAAKMIQKMLKRPDRLLGVIIIGNQLANNMAVASLNIMADQVYGHKGVIIATFIMTLIILIFAEVMPKTLAAFYPEKVSYGVRWLLQVLHWVLYPLVWLVNGISNGFLRCFGIKFNQKGVESLGNEELRGLINVGVPNMPRQHKNMLMGVLDLDFVTVNDVMVPRNEIQALDLNQVWDKVLEYLENCNQAEVLVYEGQIDQIKGVLSLSKVIELMSKGCFNKSTLLRNLQETHFIPEGVSLSKQLKNFQDQGYLMGLIVDEYGDLAGMISMNDIVEEIIGQYDPKHRTQKMIEPADDGGYLVVASCNIRDLNRAQGWQLPVDGPNTLNGLIIEYLEHIPAVPVGLKINRYLLEIISIKDKQIEYVKIIEQPEQEEV